MTIPVLDLFAGYGGFTLAAALASPQFQTIAFAENDPYASALLAHRFPDIPNFGDVRGVTHESVLARCGTLPRVVTGGFPCQPHSGAGQRRASADDRDLWPECARVLRELRPKYALFENVAGLYTSERGAFFNRVLSDLAEIGYACSWETLSAADIGAPHQRKRAWLLCVDELADAGGVRHDGRAVPDAVDGEGVSELPQRRAARGEAVGCGAGGNWPARTDRWPARPGQPQHGWEPARTTTEDRQAQPELGRSADGPADRVDATAGEVREAQAAAYPDDTVNRTPRVKALGNGIVPQCAALFLEAIAEVELLG